MENYLYEIEKHISCFDFTHEDFNLLRKTPVELMGLISNRIYRITPLLDQIALYAYGVALMAEYEYDYLEEKASLKVKDEANEVMELCFQYMLYLVDEGCMHPSVLIYKDIINGESLYTDIMDIVADSLDMLSGDIHSDFSEFLEIVDGKVEDYLYNSDTEVIEKIKEATTSKMLLKAVGEKARNLGMIRLLAASNFTSYNFDNTWVQCHIDSKDDNSSIAFINLMKIIEENYPYIAGEYDGFSDNYSSFEYYELDNTLKENFDNIKNAYMLYKQYQNDYVKNSYKEAKILKICNIM